MYAVQKNVIRIKAKTKNLRVLTKDQETMETSFDYSGDEAAILTQPKVVKSVLPKAQMVSVETPILEAGLQTSSSSNYSGDPHSVTWAQALHTAINWFAGRDASETAQFGIKLAHPKKDPFLDKFISGAPHLSDDEKQSGLHRAVRTLKTFVVIPWKSGYYYWSLVTSMAFLYNLFTIVARYSFEEFQTDFLPLWLFLDYVCDLIYVVDTFLESRKAFLRQGLLVVNVKLLTWRYLKSTAFILDLLSVVPTDILYAIFSVNQPLLRINRILKFHRLTDFADRVETQTSFPNCFRLGKLLLLLLIVIHWNGCLFYDLSKMEGNCEDTWVYCDEKIVNPSPEPINYTIVPLTEVHNEQLNREREERFLSENLTEPIFFTNLTRRYLFSFYWSALVLMTIGQQEDPVRNWEFVFHTVDILLGLLIVATILGNVGEMIINLNAAETEFQERLDSVKLFMKIRKLRPSVQTRIIKWFHYIWSQRQIVDDEEVINALPTKLRAELATQNQFRTLKMVPLFRDLEGGLLVELVLKLKLRIYSPGDFVCHKGDVGKEMFIVKSGRLSVVADDGQTIFATLEKGSVFGELSIMNIAGCKTGNRRTATVRSLGYTDLFVLSKDDLWDALSEYPEAKKYLLRKGREILIQEGLIDPRETVVDRIHESVDSKLARIDKDLYQLEKNFEKLFFDYSVDNRQMKQTVTSLENIAREKKKAIQKDMLYDFVQQYKRTA